MAHFFKKKLMHYYICFFGILIGRKKLTIAANQSAANRRTVNLRRKLPLFTVLRQNHSNF